MPDSENAPAVQAGSDRNNPRHPVADALAAKFNPDELGWLPRQIVKRVNGNRADFSAMAIAYINAKQVEDRLDEVVGPLNWKDSYTILDNGCVTCRLSIRIDGEWITKEDVGDESQQENQGDRTKSAFSDAIKRVAVKWGIGRYLGKIPPIWVPCEVSNPGDSKFRIKKFIVHPTSKLPKEFAPDGWEPKFSDPSPNAAPDSAPTPSTGGGNPPAQASKPAPAQQSAQAPATQPAGFNGRVNTSPGYVPSPGDEFFAWLGAKDEQAWKSGVIANQGELVKFIVDCARKEGLTAPTNQWPKEAVVQACQDTNAFLGREEKKPGRLLARINQFNNRILEKYPNSAANFADYCKSIAAAFPADHPLFSLSKVAMQNWPNTEEVRAWVQTQAGVYSKSIDTEKSGK